MFQLIVAVVSVALVVAIAIAMIFYGGSVFLQGTDKARYAQYLNQGSQIEGAMKMYMNQKGSNIDAPSDQVVPLLIKGDETYTYLSSNPQGNWYVDSGTIYRSLDGDGECKRINIVAKGQTAVDAIGGTGCPSCTEPTTSDWPGCSKTAFTVATTPGSP